MRVAHSVGIDWWPRSSRPDSDVKSVGSVLVVVCDVDASRGSSYDAGSDVAARELGFIGGCYARMVSVESADVEIAVMSVCSVCYARFLSDSLLSSNVVMGRAWLLGVLYCVGGCLIASLGASDVSMSFIGIVE